MSILDQVKVEKQIKSELEIYQEKQATVERLQQELESSPQFAAFIEAQKALREIEANVWGRVETVMMENNIRTIKTDMVTLSIATRTSYDIDLDKLPKKFIKRVPDTTKIATAHKLNGMPPAGASPKQTNYLVKRFK
jgi:hypothetical protein